MLPLPAELRRHIDHTTFEATVDRGVDIAVGAYRADRPCHDGSHPPQGPQPTTNCARRRRRCASWWARKVVPFTQLASLPTIPGRQAPWNQPPPPMAVPVLDMALSLLAVRRCWKGSYGLGRVARTHELRDEKRTVYASPGVRASGPLPLVAGPALELRHSLELGRATCQRRATQWPLSSGLENA